MAGIALSGQSDPDKTTLDQAQSVGPGRGTMAKTRKIIAVIFGGRSVEHDVSVLTGLQFLDALDAERFEGLPVYIAPDGSWWSGEALRRRSLYPVAASKSEELIPVSLDIAAGPVGQPALKTVRKGLLRPKVEYIPFDLMVPAIHGTNGEDGSLQGLLEFADIPYAGSNCMASAITMDKHATKRLLAPTGVPMLPHALVPRREEGGLLPQSDIAAHLADGLGEEPDFPLCVKPQRLGSSVGVTKAEEAGDLSAALIAVYRMDSAAIVEPFVPNLVEYNIAVSRAFGHTRLSAIERPLRGADVLDFKDKYLAGGTGGPKLDDVPLEGMASSSREIDPKDLTDEQRAVIEDAARTAFDVLGLAGSARIDFLSNGETGDIWFNEINSIPGSFAYYLWEAASPQVSFTELTTALISEGLGRAATRASDTSAATGGARIFDRG